ncbi:hypothetical protein QA633_21490 [Bradyrhizobium barranii]|nr:hypothetical protein [Bradyrhizobium barranii]WFT99441.1 hypothetical protein QA633_21490 [Bradyrhizobium barranii]
MKKAARTKAIEGDKHKVWLADVLPNHERLAPIVHSLLEEHASEGEN